MDRFQCGTCKKSTDSWNDVRRDGWYFLNQQTLDKDDKGVPVWAVHQGKFCSAECLEVFAALLPNSEVERRVREEQGETFPRLVTPR